VTSDFDNDDQRLGELMLSCLNGTGRAQCWSDRLKEGSCLMRKSTIAAGRSLFGVPLAAALTIATFITGTVCAQDSPFASRIPTDMFADSFIQTSAADCSAKCSQACGAGDCSSKASCGAGRAGCGAGCSDSESGCPVLGLWDAISSPSCGNGPGTLMRWSYGSGEIGGPNLDEPLITDRPDFTEASSTVGKGVLQIEFGYTYTQNRDNGNETISQSIGEPLFRYGILADWLEFRFAAFPTIEERNPAGGPSNTTSGTEDLYLGFKIGLTPQEGILPEMAILPQMTVPSGSSAFTNNQTLPGVNWLYSWALSDELSVAGSTQFNRAVNDTGDAYTEWAQSATAAFGLTDEAGGYVEWYALFPHAATGGVKPEHYLNGGFTYLLSSDVQFDIRAGYGLNDVADDVFIGSGFSVRFR
jgi:hypothetical protein